MRKFLLKILLFFLIVAGVDYAFGLLCRILINNSHSGTTASITGILKGKKHDVIIMGSSRCVCHYDDRIMSNSLGLNVTNVGEKGNGIVLMYGRYKIILDSHKPQILLYDVEPSFDVLEYEKDDNNKRYLAGLKLFYDEHGIKDIFYRVDKTEILKMHSFLYRYNSNLLSLIQDYLSHRSVVFSRYQPSHQNYKNIVGSQKDRNYDELKLCYFEQLIKDTQEEGINLIVIASPKYIVSSKKNLQPVVDLCSEYNIPFWDYYDEMHDKKWFCDNMHLNYKGSQVFTQIICKRLQEEILLDK